MHNKDNKDKIVAQIVLSWYAAGQHEFCLRVWSYILLTVWLLPSNLLKAAWGFGRALVAVACAVWCQELQVCLVCMRAHGNTALHKSPSPHPNQMVISDILGILKTLEHKAPLLCLFLDSGPFDIGNANYETEQIPHPWMFAPHHSSLCEC